MLIIGVGNTAMDCCRSSLRLGAKDVKVMARKPREFFKASDWELEDAEEERVEIVVNHSPKEFVIEDGKLVGMKFDELEYELDADGRDRRPAVVARGVPAVRRRRARDRPGERVSLDRARPWASSSTSTTCRSSTQTTFQSTRPGVFFGGDAAFGPKNIIWAVEHGHQAAISIHKHCEGTSLDGAAAARREPRRPRRWAFTSGATTTTTTRRRARIMPHVDLKERFKKLNIEVELGFTRRAGRAPKSSAASTATCRRCSRRSSASSATRASTSARRLPHDHAERRRRRSFEARLKAPRSNADQPFFVSAPLKQTGRVMLKDENLCVHCGLCAERCPTGAWDMQKSTVSIPYATDEARQTMDQWQNARKAG